MESFYTFLLITIWTVFFAIIARSIWTAGHPIIALIIFFVLMGWLFGGSRKR